MTFLRLMRSNCHLYKKLNFPVSNNRKIDLLKAPLIFVLLIASFQAHAATPGLPFTENFSNTALQDITNSTANWSTKEKADYLAWRKQRLARFAASDAPVGSEPGNNPLPFNIALNRQANPTDQKASRL